MVHAPIRNRSQKLITSAAVIFMFFSCQPSPPIPGFSPAEGDSWIRLIRFGEDENKPLPGDYITADISYQTTGDSVFFEGRRKFQLTPPDYPGSIGDCLAALSKGDSAIFLMRADSFFRVTLQSDYPSFLSPGSYIKVHLGILDVQTEIQYQMEKEAFLNWINDFSDYERVILTQFIEGKKLDVTPSPSGLYYLRIKPGNGRKIAKGDTITIDYEGKFLNGRFFDSTIRRNEAFTFVFGTEWQVIKGLEEGIGYMEEEEKALFILPSDLGFGIEGSSTGIIPPYTSIIYELEVKRVAPGKQ